MKTVLTILHILLLTTSLNAQSKTNKEQQSGRSELATKDLVAMKIIDTTLTTHLSETCYCDTTIQLNDSIHYSVIRVNDQAGLCTYFFVASFNKKAENAIASALLHPDCDVDYSSDSYDLHEHAIISKNKIRVINTTVFQKKNRTSPDEEKNIDHKESQKTFITISQTGQINYMN